MFCASCGFRGSCEFDGLVRSGGPWALGLVSLVGLVGLMGLAGLVGLLSLLGLVGLVGLGCYVRLFVGVFWLSYLIHRCFLMEIWSLILKSLMV